MARRANEKGKLLENAGVENLAQEVGVVRTADTEQEATLRQFELEMVEHNQEAITAQHPKGDTHDVKVIQVEPDNYLSTAEGE